MNLRNVVLGVCAAGIATLLGGVLVVPAGAAPAPKERPPVCTRVSVSENSGNGPDYHVHLCGTVFNSEREDGVYCIVDGSAWGPRAVVFCNFGAEDGD